MDRSGAKDGSNRMLAVMLLILLVITVGLSAVIIYRFVKIKNTVNGRDEIVAVDDVKDILVIDGGDIDAGIAVFQQHIDDAVNEKKVELLKQRIDYIITYDLGSNYREQVLNDSIEIYNLEGGLTNAIQVYNFAHAYDYEEVASEYAEIIEQLEEEVDDGEGIG